MATLKIHGLSPSTFTPHGAAGVCTRKASTTRWYDAMPNTIGALNPFGKIPAITHGELTLYESIAILRYLESGSFQGRKLWPDDVAAGRRFAISGRAPFTGQLAVNCRAALFRSAPPASCRCRRKWHRSISPRRRRWCRSSTASSDSIRFLAGNSFDRGRPLPKYPLYAYFPDVAGLKAIADKAPNVNRWAREMAARPSAVATEPGLFKPQIAA